MLFEIPGAFLVDDLQAPYFLCRYFAPGNLKVFYREL